MKNCLVFDISSKLKEKLSPANREVKSSKSKKYAKFTYMYIV